jgi:catechol 2,3-dioxygenase-like lactoylglutathione lyase family enzyme
MGRVVPVLRIFDVAKAFEFYRDFLGFAVDWEHRFQPGLPIYTQVSRDDAALHLTEHHGDASPGARVRIETHGLATYHATLVAKRYPYAYPAIESQPWGEMSMTIADPFGNRLTFFESDV